MEDPFANYLHPGDVVEAEVEHVGVLRTPIISWREGHGSDPPPEAGQWLRGTVNCAT